MSNYERPTFDLNELPSEANLRMETEHDLQLLEEGMSPDEIADARQMVRRAREETREYETILQPYLDQYGVDFESELPAEVQIKLADIRRIYFRGGRTIE